VVAGATLPPTYADFASSARTLALLIAPAVLLVGPVPWRDPRLAAHLRRHRVPLLALALCLVAIVPVCSKCGSGPHHLLPFTPLLGYEYVLLFRASRQSPSRWSTPLRFAWSMLALVVTVRAAGGVGEAIATWTHEADTTRATAADIRSILERYPFERIEMGYGATNQQATNLRPALVFASDRLTVDEAALTDMQLAGMRLPQATIDALTSCATPIWLIPRDEPPFSLPNLYGLFHPQIAPVRPLFDREFREAFLLTYKRHESTEYFDVWRCDRGPPAEQRQSRE
jgi:hypothetical protein